MHGWIKLHRQALENEIFRYDKTAWHVFEVLLLAADKKTGSWSGGRFRLAELCDMNSNTAYKALKRLEKAGMVTLESNNKFTQVYICKWGEYQGNSNTSGNNKLTSNEHQNNTLTRKEELRSREQVPYGKPEINRAFEVWEEQMGYPITSRRQANRNAANNLLKKHGVEKVERLIKGAAIANEDQYAPTIGDFTELQSKFNKLMAWGKKKSNNQGGIVDV